MKKQLLTIFILLLAARSWSQDREVMTEEKSSAWLKIAAPVTVVHRTIAVKKKTTANVTASNKKKAVTPPKPAPAVVPKTTDEFNKTNSKVKRFQKN